MVNLSSNISASDWLLSYDLPSQMDVTDWPWSQLTPEQVSYLQTQRSGSWHGAANLYLVYVLCPFGMLGNLFVLLALLFGKRHEAYTAFDNSMLGVAFLDLVFVLIKFPYAYIDTIVEHRTIFQWVAGGILYSCSMMSDLIILCLTIDRYVSVGFPVEYSANPGRRILAWRTGLLISFLLSATRFHYWINDVLACGTGVDKNPVMCNLKYDLNYFSDMVAPFVYMLIMFVLVALILRALWRRSRKVGQLSNNQADKAFAQFKRNLGLLVVMFIMYFLNQFGYMFYCICYACFGHWYIDFDCSYIMAKIFVIGGQVYPFSNVTANLLEVASRSLTFYPYVVFSASFRGYFRSLFKRGGNQNENSVASQASKTASVKAAWREG